MQLLNIKKLNEILDEDLEVVKSTADRSGVSVKLVAKNYELFMKEQMQALSKFIAQQENLMYGCDEKVRLLHLNDLPVDELKEIKLNLLKASVKAEQD